MREDDWVGMYRNIGRPSGDANWDSVGTTWRNRYVGSALHRPVSEILDSVLASGVADRLFVNTAMDDLSVASAAADHETITVLSATSYPLVPGHMGLSFYSHGDRRREFRQYLIEDAVEAFWDMLEEKWGITR